MSKRPYTPSYPAELCERGVRLFKEHRAEYASDNAAYRAIAPKLGCSPDSLRVWCQRAERDTGERPGLTSAERDRSEPLKAPLVQAQWTTISPMSRPGRGGSTSPS
ncbi:hypothetical protein SAMN05444722_2169 [Rhodovulum sp. ES.010]|uniref:hypothetical protein n=1 Tax=Rhodovulum sp. ES.010 TaxID=1882821 RepID=UPI00092597A6|nr:hypothetical protein [Rhodovulum sp. ES.010]SIO44115.1 hypothetical protein SAMN05444722_2169 [Rhodovulum sp. ES.010]